MQVGVIYTGENANIPLENLVVYRNIFQKDKFFTREYNDLIEELSEEKQKQYGQVHRIEKLAEEEIKLIKSEEFRNEKLKYIENKR